MPRPRRVNGGMPAGPSGLKAVSFSPEQEDSRLEILLYQIPKYIPGRTPPQPPISLLQPADSDAFIVDKVVTPLDSVVMPDDSQSRIRQVLHYVIAWPDRPTAWELVPCCDVLDYVSPRTVEDWEYEQTLLLQQVGKGANYRGGGGEENSKLRSETEEQKVALTTNQTARSPEMKEQEQTQDAVESRCFAYIDSAITLSVDSETERPIQTLRRGHGNVLKKRRRGRPPKHTHIALLQAATNEKARGQQNREKTGEQCQQQRKRLSLAIGEMPVAKPAAPPIIPAMPPAGRQRIGFSLSTLFSPSDASRSSLDSASKALRESDPGPYAFSDYNNEDLDEDVDMIYIAPVADDDGDNQNENNNENDGTEEKGGDGDVDGRGKEVDAALISTYINSSTTAVHSPLANGALRSPRPQPSTLVAKCFPGELSGRDFGLAHAQKQKATESCYGGEEVTAVTGDKTARVLIGMSGIDDADLFFEVDRLEDDVFTTVEDDFGINRVVQLFMVRWKGDWPSDQNPTWEPADNLPPEMVRQYLKKKAHQGAIAMQTAK